MLPTVLFLDEDPAIGRQARLSLHGIHCQVISTALVAEGLQLAAQEEPDLIVLETQYQSIDGLTLAAQLNEKQDKKSWLIAFLTIQTALSRRLSALQQGAADYIIKTGIGHYPKSRVLSLIQKIPHLQASAPRSINLSPLVEQVTKIEKNSATVVMQLIRPSERARIVFQQGKVLFAECGAWRGEDALNYIGRRDDWQVDFDDADYSSDEFSSERMEDTEPEKEFRQAIKRPEETKQVGSFLKDGAHFSIPIARDGGNQARDEPLGHHQRNALHPEARSGAELDCTGEEANKDTDRTNLADTLAVAEQRKTQAEPEPADLAGFEEEVPTLSYDKVSPRMEEWLVQSSLNPSSVAPPPREVVAVMQESVSSVSSVDAGRPSVTSSPSALPEQPSRIPPSSIHTALGASPRAPVIILVINAAVRLQLVQALDESGLTAQEVSTGLEAYQRALQLSPTAIIADDHGPKVNGRELLAAIRSDFKTREIPFLIISSKQLADQLVGKSAAALQPIIQGVQAALTPRMELRSRLASGERMLSGRVEPIGIVTLLRVLHEAKATGKLTCSSNSAGHAQLAINQGELVDLGIKGAEPLNGLPATLPLFGMEWHTYSFEASASTSSPQPLLPFLQLLDTGIRQNNLIVDHVFQNGVNPDEMVVDHLVLDDYLQKIPLGSLKLLIRIVEGEKAIELATQGIATPSLLRSLIHDLRRKSVIRPQSTALSMFDLGTIPSLPALDLDHGIKQPIRWLIVLLACLATVVVAVGGYYLLRILLS